MSSFYAELRVGGHVYPLLSCDYSAHQNTDGRGRPTSRVRHGPLHMMLDAPRDSFLPVWASIPHKPLPGQVVFYSDHLVRVPQETIAFAAGECVHFGMEFQSSHAGQGAYVAFLTITAPVFELLAGGPSALPAGPPA